jgi:hypothetical protein
MYAHFVTEKNVFMGYKVFRIDIRGQIGTNVSHCTHRGLIEQKNIGSGLKSDHQLALERLMTRRRSGQ